MPTQRRSQKERTEKTTRAILDAATQLFAERGFRGVALETVVERTGLTRGALYHHFANKEQLFVGVVERVEKALAERIVSAAASAQGPIDQLAAGYGEFLDACLEPEVQRILLLDAPAVLGVERWRSVDADYGLGLLQQGLRAAMAAGILREQPVRPLAHVLLGALTESGLYVASAANPDAARAEVEGVLAGFLSGLITD